MRLRRTKVRLSLSTLPIPTNDVTSHRPCPSYRSREASLCQAVHRKLLPVLLRSRAHPRIRSPERSRAASYKSRSAKLRSSRRPSRASATPTPRVSRTSRSCSATLSLTREGCRARCMSGTKSGGCSMYGLSGSGFQIIGLQSPLRHPSSYAMLVCTSQTIQPDRLVQYSMFISGSGVDRKDGS